MDDATYAASEVEREALWASYSASRSPEAEEALVKSYEPYAHAITTSMVAPCAQMYDDMRQVALLGLLQAIRRYEVGTAPFLVYAKVRIRGAIVDEMRRTGYLNRKAYGHWRAGHHEDDEGPFMTHLDVEEFLHLKKLPDGGRTPAERMADLELAAAIMARVEQVSTVHSEVLDLIYLRDLKTVEVARKLGVSPSRVSQLDGAALVTARRALFHLDQPACVVA